jgi:hypothetical protein
MGLACPCLDFTRHHQPRIDLGIFFGSVKGLNVGKTFGNMVSAISRVEESRKNMAKNVMRLACPS